MVRIFATPLLSVTFMRGAFFGFHKFAEPIHRLDLLHDTPRFAHGLARDSILFDLTANRVNAKMRDVQYLKSRHQKMTNQKIERERTFHNQRFSHAADPREHLNKWYASIRHGAERQNRLVLDYASGKDVLEYGCADGWLSVDELKLPGKARSLTGIDISDVAIQKAAARARPCRFLERPVPYNGR